MLKCWGGRTKLFADVSAAFSTRLHEETTLSDSPLIFGIVDLNIGDGYDEFTGVLTSNHSDIISLTNEMKFIK